VNCLALKGVKTLSDLCVKVTISLQQCLSGISLKLFEVYPTSTPHKNEMTPPKKNKIKKQNKKHVVLLPSTHVLHLNL